MEKDVCEYTSYLCREKLRLETHVFNILYLFSHVKFKNATCLINECVRFTCDFGTGHMLSRGMRRFSMWDSRAEKV